MCALVYCSVTITTKLETSKNAHMLSHSFHRRSLGPTETESSTQGLIGSDQSNSQGYIFIWGSVSSLSSHGYAEFSSLRL